jgi:hypothetical protein
MIGHDLACGRSSPRSGRRIGYVMSMRPVAWPEPDPQVAAAIDAMYGTRKTARPLAVLIRDRLGQWLSDEAFRCRVRDAGQAWLVPVAAGAGDGAAAGGEPD